MWHYGDRHNPLHPRFHYYLDNRPILPQDGTRGFFSFRKLSDPYALKYYVFKSGGSKNILLSTNIPAEEREELSRLEGYYSVFNKSLTTFSVLPTIALSSIVYKYSDFSKSKFLVPLVFLINYSFVSGLIKGYFSSFISEENSYHYQKYSHLAKQKISDIEDPRRRFFRPDTSVYYRETPQEIFEQKSHAQLHDSSIYYGPHPFDDHENLDSVMEINKKFMEGHSVFDKEELVLGEPIDIKRKIRDIPTVDEYKSI